MKRFFLMACVAISMLGFTAKAADYYIYTVADLQALANRVNGGTNCSGDTYYLMNDLNLSGVSWTPIGFWSKDNVTNTDRDKKPFKGVFDGQNKTISYCTVNLNNNGQNCTGTGRKVTAGLFGYISGATIKNLAVTNSNISLESNCHNNYAGAIAGWMDGAI